MFVTENFVSKSQIEGVNDQIRAGKLEGTQINTIGTRSMEQNHFKRAESRDRSKANLGQYFWYFRNCKEKFGGFGGWSNPWQPWALIPLDEASSCLETSILARSSRIHMWGRRTRRTRGDSGVKSRENARYKHTHTIQVRFAPLGLKDQVQ